MNLGDIPEEAVHAALIQSEGDFAIAAALISKDLTVDALKHYVDRRPHLKSIFNDNPNRNIETPTEGEQLTRYDEEGVDEPTYKVFKQTFDETMKTMEDVGVGANVVSKIRRLNQGSVNNAAFLATSLNMTQQMMSYHVMKIMERMEEIEDRIMDNKTPSKEKVQLQYLWNACSDLLGKHNDRLLNATATLYKLGKRAKQSKKEKPGYSTYDTLDVS